jgi:predicted DNA-binding transcriptional regulator AlpA
MNPPSSERLLTAGEVAALLQVTRSWVYEQTRRNLMPMCGSAAGSAIGDQPSRTGSPG